VGLYGKELAIFQVFFVEPVEVGLLAISFSPLLYLKLVFGS
jgi:hypothetical protein